MEFSQTDRLLQLTTPLKSNKLLLTNFVAIEEISHSFNFSLDMLSTEKNILPEQLIGKPITVKLYKKGYERYFNGVVTHFILGAIEDNVRHYHAEAAPWLYLLDLASDCCIYQNKSVVDIIKIIFGKYGFSNYNLSGVTKSYPKREYCVQYNETTLNFIERILQEEGIFYFFHHEEGKHTLMLADSSNAFQSCIDESAIFSHGSSPDYHLNHWETHTKLYTGKFSRTDYNFETPDANLFVESSNSPILAAAKKYEMYQYPGSPPYANVAAGKVLTERHFQSSEMYYNVANVTGNYPSFTAGGKFKLGDGAANLSSDKDYYIAHISHYISDLSHTGVEDEGDTSQSYSNSFSCIPLTVPFSPSKRVTKPTIQGVQTAIVVGQPGEEIYTDQYGRVKVQFHWDRKGNKDDYTSCWIRVAQTLAGKNFGALFMPRVGQEVVVQFLEGNPDRPLIIGSVYNADHLPPYNLPDCQTRSGFKTRSTKGGGDSDSNELCFEDRMGQEEIFIQAQKDFNQTVKHDLNIQVGHQSTLQAQQAIELKVGGNSLVINTEGIFINGAKVDINN